MVVTVSDLQFDGSGQAEDHRCKIRYVLLDDGSGHHHLDLLGEPSVALREDLLGELDSVSESVRAHFLLEELGGLSFAAEREGQLALDQVRQKKAARQLRKL